MLQRKNGDDCHSGAAAQAAEPGIRRLLALAQAKLGIPGSTLRVAPE
ncbi:MULTISPECIES: hypothetical protein [unclassified Bradyrhizobium]|nr:MULTISPECIES: hypothetical protein [unclassified Bradyrhizobium]